MLKRPDLSPIQRIQQRCMNRAKVSQNGEPKADLVPVNELAKKRVEEAHKQIESLPFPLAPDGKICAPNDMIRSAFFGAIERGERIRVQDYAIPGPNNITLILNGWRPDQIDAEIFFWLHNRAKGTKPGELIYFRLWDLLQHLGYKKPGGGDYDDLKRRLEQMHDTTVRYKTERGRGGVGALISSFEIEESTKEAVVRTNPDIRRFFDSVTYLSTEHTASLRGSPLALWLYRIIASHAEWIPMLVKTVLERSGSKSSAIKFFKRTLIRALTRLQEKGHIDEYSFEPSAGGELLYISRTPTPTQIRHLAKRRSNGVTVTDPRGDGHRPTG